MIKKPLPFGCGLSISVSLVSVSKRHACHFAKALDFHRLRQAWANIAREISRRKANDVGQFVRVWRGAIASAARTLKSGADPKGTREDVLSTNEGKIRAIVPENEMQEHRVDRLNLLFGASAVSLLERASAENYLKFSIHATASLRHKSFHFTDVNNFLAALKQLHTPSAKYWVSSGGQRQTLQPKPK